LERKRGQSFDEDSARLLAEHHASWRALFPYFEKLPGLGSEEFRALASFAAAVSKRDAETQNRIVGEWHSLVELTELGVAAGSLDSAAAARAFRGACEGLSAPGYSAGALAALRAMAGGADDPDEAVASGLLRLTGERRAAFDRLRALQHAPLLASLTGAGDAQTLAALSGLVYAALLDPRDLLASEDPQFLAKHQFRTGTRVRGADLFLPSVLILASQSPGSYLEGGFANFKEQTKDLARALADNGDTPPAPVPRKNAPAVGKAAAADPVASTARSSESTAPPEAVFRANSSLVEVYATVMDGRDRYVDGLTPDDFLVLDGGQPVEVFGGGQSADLAAFESRAFPVSVALLLDATGSMRLSLPALKAAAFRLIHDLRPIDSAAVYCFNNAITELQPFTSDKEAAGRAVLKVRAEGNTALNDALVRITRDLAGRGGKRVIVVFTDGADNASGLTSDAVAQRARAVGVPIYTIAHGDALKDAALLKNLDAVARDTGALAFALRTPDEMAGVFAQVSKDIEHGYYFTFRPAPGGSRTWRPIEVRLRKNPSRKVRAREGYVVN
jgi:VWFA-related protein